MTSRSSRRRFLARVLAAGAAVLPRRMAAALTGGIFGPGPRSAAAASRQSGALTHGPFRGDLSPNGVRIWARCSEEGPHVLVARGAGRTTEVSADARPQADRGVVWRLSGLDPGARYRYEILRGGRTVFAEPSASFVTPAPPDAPALVRMAIGSCAREEEGDRAVWRRMAAEDPHAVVLLGDTPYIDSTDLGVQRARYGEFAAVPELAALLRTRPLYATWDDHDFGANDTDGRLEGKEDARRAFVEYHANPSYGDGSEGVYTSFRLGGAEVFLLDTRYFAGIERSPIAEGPSLLGRRQWAWLRDGLRASDAPFKLLASGVVWNGAVRPGKPDHWDSYAAERDAIFRFIGAERISGIVLLAGDVHRTRVLRYDTMSTAGYALTELITSPIHDGVIEDANAPHPALVHDSGAPHSFLVVDVDTTASPATLHARFQDAGGRELYALTLDAATLTAA